MPPPIVPIGGFNNARGALVNPVVSTPSPAPVFRAAAGALDVLAQLQTANDARRDALRSVAVEGEYDRQTDAAMAEVNPLDADATAQVRDIYRQADEDAVNTANFVTAEAQNDLAINLAARAEGALTAFQLSRRDALETEALRLRAETEDAVLAKIRQDPPGADAYLAEFSRQAAKTNASISPQLLPGLNEAFADRAIIAQAEGLAQAGDFKTARAFADANQEQLTPQAFRGLKGRLREIENTLRAENNAATDGVVADLEIKLLKTVTDGGDLDAAEQQVEAARAAGLFENREQTRVRLVRTLEMARRARRQDTLDRLAVQNKMQLGQGLGSKKEAALGWKMLTERLAPDIALDEMLEQARLFAANTGWLAPPLAEQIVNAERVENPELLAAATRVYDAVQPTVPQAEGIRDIGPRVALTSAMVELFPDMDYQTAADTVMAKLPDQTEIERRRIQFEIDFDDFNSFEEVDDIEGFDGIPVTQRVADAYERTLRLLYEMHGQADIAEKAAKRIFKQRFSVSEVGGVAHVMEFAPEVHFQGSLNNDLNSGQKTAIIDDLVSTWLADRNIGVPPAVIGAESPTGVVVPGGVSEDLLAAIGGPVTEPGIEDTSGIPAFTLIADERTKQDRRQDLPATYEVRVRNTFGVLVPPFADPQANRFRMPTLEETSATEVYQEIVAGKMGGIQERRARQRAREEKIEKKRRNIPQDTRPPEGTGMRSKSPDRLGPGDFGVPERDDDIGRMSRTQGIKPSFSATQLLGISPAVAGQVSRGIRNNNPGNIERTATRWQGMAAKQSDKRFIVFATPEMGLRAMARVFTTYQRKHGLLTVRQMVARWAPSVENDTDAYVASVAAHTGLDPDRGINLQQDHVMLKFLKAIILHENGDQPYDDATVRRGIRMSR